MGTHLRYQYRNLFDVVYIIENTSWATYPWPIGSPDYLTKAGHKRWSRIDFPPAHLVFVSWRRARRVSILPIRCPRLVACVRCYFWKMKTWHALPPTGLAYQEFRLRDEYQRVGADTTSHRFWKRWNVRDGRPWPRGDWEIPVLVHE